MNLRQLECFVAVVDEGSFTRAARRVGITQPSLSQHIRALETELDGPVFNRLPRGVSLTPAGRTLLPDARIAVRAFERGIAARGRRSRRRRRARDRDGALDGGRRAAAATSASGTSGTRTWRSGCTSSATGRCSRTRSSRGSPTSRSGRCPSASGTARSRWSAGRSSCWSCRDATPSPSRQRVRLEELADREWVLYHPDHGLAGIVESSAATQDSRRAAPCGHRRRRALSGSRRPGSASRSSRTTSSSGHRLRRAGDRAAVLRDIAVYARVPLSPTATAFVDVVRSAGRPRPRRRSLDPSLDCAACAAPRSSPSWRCSSPAAAATRSKLRRPRPVDAAAVVREGARERSSPRRPRSSTR